MILPTLLQVEQPALLPKALPDGQETDWPRVMRDGASTPHVPGLSIGTQVRPVEKRVHLRLVILSSSLPQTMSPPFVHWEQPACPVKEMPLEHPERS